MGVFSNLLKQMNAKVKMDIFRLHLPISPSMIVGFDVVNEGKKSLVGITASYNKYYTQYYS